MGGNSTRAQGTVPILGTTEAVKHREVQTSNGNMHLGNAGRAAFRWPESAFQLWRRHFYSFPGDCRHRASPAGGRSDEEGCISGK
jgi:hypothetical protein